MKKSPQNTRNETAKKRRKLIKHEKKHQTKRTQTIKERPPCPTAVWTSPPACPTAIQTSPKKNPSVIM